MLTVKNLIKTAAVVSSMLFAMGNYADTTAESVQVAQLTEGFNAEEKYMASCFACHSTGAAGAPKVGPGNAGEWAPRLEKGMEAVVANAINGLNTMPPKGLCFDCTDEDLAALVQYMVDSSSE